MTETKIRSTEIIEKPPGATINLIIADNDDLDEADEAISCSVQLSEHKGWFVFAAIQREALQRIREIVDAEIQRTAHTVNQRPG